ncbi:gluconate 2-dehydrogenase subunit 3 family protein [Phenylobacterium sp.]|jgi:hypothetical protein|uniref:gluconate 2-dehydrogenase subunit 3 family protein n=1 Tax=Phenylobacterium sp. TaxID=1871053 RepID=UPI002F92A79B
MSDEAPKAYVSTVDRRTALIWVSAAAAAGMAGTAVVFGPKVPKPESVKGYGTDPNLVKPAPAPWPRILTKDELQATAVLADFILPATATAPAASALGIPDFIDEWVSAPYPDQVKDRPIVRDGLKKLIPDIVRGDAAKRTAALSALPRSTGDDREFFRKFRRLVVGAYYTTEVGFKDIGYIGNEARGSDPGPSAEVKAVLEQRLKALGL